MVKLYVTASAQWMGSAGIKLDGADQTKEQALETNNLN